MKRWGQIKGDVDYKAVAEQVYLATDTRKVMTEMGLTPPASAYKSFSVMGKTFRSGEARRLSRELQDQEGSREEASALIHVVRGGRPGSIVTMLSVYVRASPPSALTVHGAAHGVPASRRGRG